MTVAWGEYSGGAFFFVLGSESRRVAFKRVVRFVTLVDKAVHRLSSPLAVAAFSWSLSLLWSLPLLPLDNGGSIPLARDWHRRHVHLYLHTGERRLNVGVCDLLAGGLR